MALDITYRAGLTIIVQDSDHDAAVLPQLHPIPRINDTQREHEYFCLLHSSLVILYRK